MSPMSWSSHKVKRSVSASLAGEECEWISGMLEPAVYQDCECPVTVGPTTSMPKSSSFLQKHFTELVVLSSMALPVNWEGGTV